MKNFYALVLLVGLTIVGCSKDDEVAMMNPEPETPPVSEEVQDSITYFTLNVNENWFGNLRKSGYLVINDQEGKLIDYRKIENDTQYLFKAKEGEEPEKFTITSFDAGGSDSFELNFANSYFNIDQGTIWNFNGFTSTSSPAVNTITFNLNVENIEGWSDYALSNDNTFLDSTNSSTASSLSFLDILKFDDQKFMLTVYFGPQVSKYIILDPVTDGETITINGDELLDFDSFIDINVPNDGRTYSKNLSADYNNRTTTFRTARGIALTSPTSDKLGLLDAFSNYSIIVSTSNSEKNYLYQYNSNVPENINIISTDADFTLLNDAIDAFQFETTTSHDTKISTWEERVQLSNGGSFFKNWSFSSNKEPYHKIPELPADLLNDYPDFKVENLQYARTTLTLGGRGYTSFFEDSGNTGNNQDLISENYIFSNPAL